MGGQRYGRQERAYPYCLFVLFDPEECITGLRMQFNLTHVSTYTSTHARESNQTAVSPTSITLAPQNHLSYGTELQANVISQH